jgi:hypothetical protein
MPLLYLGMDLFSLHSSLNSKMGEFSCLKGDENLEEFLPWTEQQILKSSFAREVEIKKVFPFEVNNQRVKEDENGWDGGDFKRFFFLCHPLKTLFCLTFNFSVWRSWLAKLTVAGRLLQKWDFLSSVSLFVWMFKTFLSMKENALNACGWVGTEVVSLGEGSLGFRESRGLNTAEILFRQRWFYLDNNSSESNDYSSDQTSRERRRWTSETCSSLRCQVAK